MDAAPGPDGPRAAEVFTAQLLPRTGGVLRRRLRLVGAFAVGLTSGVVPEPSVHDVVVTRRDDGTELLRLPTGDPSAAAHLLQSVTDELESATPDAFLRSWHVA